MSDGINTEVLVDNMEEVTPEMIDITPKESSVVPSEGGFKLPTMGQFQATLGQTATQMLATTMLVVAVRGSLWAGKKVYEGSRVLIKKGGEKLKEFKQSREEKKLLREVQTSVDEQIVHEVEEDEEN